MNRKLGSHRLVAALAAAWLTGTAVCAAVEVDGFTQPYFDVDVAASETGLLAELQVREGDRVRKGQLLASLDDAVLQATLEIAKQTMDSLGRLESAEAELRLQVDTVNKLRQLHSRRHASDQELERAEAQRTIAEARLRAAREEHRIRALECERARIQLQQRRLVAPINGVVTQIFKDRGEFVSLADPVVLKVVQLDPLLVVFTPPAAEARRLSAGAKVQVRIQDARVVQGQVEFVSPTADPQSGTTRVRVRIPNPDEQLPSGAACQLILPSKSSDGASRPRVE
ncbi:MAG: efflux RND transporter periplasmic adaptor subunit [Planctomycetales bacterium]|nr:efflux RND transporter periplasmic adaptor subunit [Planctomycetales bacterium]